MRPLFVEFVGPPGAGKTTVAEEAAKILASRGCRAAVRPDLVTGHASHLWHSLRFRWFRIANPRLRLTGLMYALSVRPLRLSRYRYIQQMMFRAYYHREMRASDYQAILLSQSVVQAAWSTAVNGRGFEEKWLDRLFAHFYREVEGAIAFVFVNLDPSTAAERVVTRASHESRFDTLPLEEVERSLTAHGEMFRTLALCARRNTGAPICYLDGSRPLSENAGQVADFVEAVLRNSQNDRERRGEHPRSSPHLAPDPAAELPA